MRGLISQVVYYYLKLYQSRKHVPHINATRLPHVALTCWFYVKDTHHDESALNYVLLVSRCTRSYAELDAFAQCAVDAFGPEPFLARFHRALDSPRVLNQELTDCVQALCEFAHHPAVLRLLGPMETCRRVIEAFRRQQRAGDPRWEWRVLSRAANLLQWGTTLFPCQIGLRPLILQHDVLVHLHRAVKKVWYPTLYALCELRPPEWKQSTEFTRLCKQWTGLGRALGFSIASEQQAFDAARTGDDREGAAARRMCAWNVCVYAKRRPLHAMLACAACNKAWYCNRACQARDWKEGRHKETCHGKAAKRS
ncbi:hypothetical protein OF83DRAFT_55319 [Amylostereum chailletii]|nr:hypothetical protein OF83DRAFT_55319 [Amylostereum chailletii]